MRRFTFVLFCLIAVLSFKGVAQNPFGHALVPDMIADASIELVGDTFYCYATTDGYGRGLDYPLSWGYYRGDRIGIYNYNNASDSGMIDIDYFHYEKSSPL